MPKSTSYQVKLAHDTDAKQSVIKWYMSHAQAVHGMKLRAYEKLEAFGKLDTQAAHDVIAKIDAGMHYIEISNTGYALYLRCPG